MVIYGDNFKGSPILGTNVGKPFSHLLPDGVFVGYLEMARGKHALVIAAFPLQYEIVFPDPELDAVFL
jgi:hypothetical protein